MVDVSAIGDRFAAVRCSLNERSRRLFAAAEARTAGYGGISASARATGVARSTIGRGLKDLDAPGTLSGVIRRPGSGRHALTVTDPTLLEDLRRLLKAPTMGDPMRPLLWVSKSHAKLAAAFGGKSARMMRPADAERLTGYRVGGISPFGQRRKVPVAIEGSTLTEELVFVNGGQRGLQVRLDPKDVQQALGAIAAPIVA
jgi:hypothetical protein